MKKIIFLLLALLATHIFADSGMTQIKHNPWELIIYRPENKTDFNYIRCYVKITDENGNDVSKTKVKATYEWASIPNVVNRYKNLLYLDGGMAMHLNLTPGKYHFSVYTPIDKQAGFECTKSIAGKFQWESNTFEYDTENPAKVIFVTPVMDDNGFFNGSWWIDHKAPRFFKWSEMKVSQPPQVNNR